MSPVVTNLRNRSIALAGLSLLVSASMVGAANAQNSANYPERPVRIVVPFPPGGAADTFARLSGIKLAETWANRQQAVIENRPGAGGIIGTEIVAKATADGYTLLMVTLGHAVNPYMYAKLPYDTAKDFTPVGVVASVPSLVVVGSAFPGKTLKDLLSAARAKPGEIQFASSGIGSTSHIGAALMESLAGIDLVHVPYKGAAPALQDVMGGRIPMTVDIITSSLQMVKTGKLRALAITSTRRSPQLPDLPTVAEAGIPGYSSVAWYMLLAPAKTPSAIVEKINADLRKVAALPDFRTRIEDAGGEPMALTTQQANEYLNAEFARWSKVVKERNIKAD